jgi:Rrf2 family protein
VIHSLIKREDDYAIRISAFLASEYLDGCRSISDIATYLALSKPITSKIVHKLNKGGIVTSIRGRNGGVKLASNPSKASFLDVLNATNFDITLNECLRNSVICPLINFCKTHVFWSELEQLVLDKLSKTYISDFMFNEFELTNSIKERTND